MAVFNEDVRDCLLSAVLLVSAFNLFVVFSVHSSVQGLTMKVVKLYQETGSKTVLETSYDIFIILSLILVTVCIAYAIVNLRKLATELKLLRLQIATVEHSVNQVVTSSAPNTVANVDDASEADSMGLEQLFACLDPSPDAASTAQNTVAAADAITRGDDDQLSPVVDLIDQEISPRPRRSRSVSSDDDRSHRSDRLLMRPKRKKIRITSGSCDLLQSRWIEDIPAVDEIGNAEMVSDDSDGLLVEADSALFTDLESVDDCNVAVQMYPEPTSSEGRDDESDSTSNVGTTDDHNRSSSVARALISLDVSTEDNSVDHQDDRWIDDEYFVTTYRYEPEDNWNPSMESARPGVRDVDPRSVRWSNDGDYGTDVDSDEEAGDRPADTGFVEDGRWEGYKVHASTQRLDRGDANKEQDEEITRRLDKVSKLINSIVTNSYVFNQLPALAASSLQTAVEEINELKSVWGKFCGDPGGTVSGRQAFQNSSHRHAAETTRHPTDTQSPPLGNRQVQTTSSGNGTRWVDDDIDDSPHLLRRVRQFLHERCDLNSNGSQQTAWSSQQLARRD